MSYNGQERRKVNLMDECQKHTDCMERIHSDIGNIKLSQVGLAKDMANLDKNITAFIEKVDKTVFHTEDGFIARTKIKLSSLCVQSRNQWSLILILLVGILGIAWNVVSKK